MTPPTPRVNVLLIDDNPLMAEAMGRWLSRTHDFRWVGSAERTHALAALVDELGADILLMDINLPGQDAFEAVARIAAERPHIRIVMFSGDPRPGHFHRAAEAGAVGFIRKDDAPAAIIAALRAAASGLPALEGRRSAG